MRQRTPTFFHFVVSEHEYLLRSDGLLLLRFGAVSKHLRLPLQGGLIDRLYASPYENDLVLMYELDDGESGWSKVTRVSANGSQVRWSAHVPGLNLATPCREAGSLYLAASGFIGKLTLKTGQFAWSHSGLYSRSHAFNVFDTPEVGESTVLFRASAQPGGSVETLLVSKESGKLLP